MAYFVERPKEEPQVKQYSRGAGIAWFIAWARPHFHWLRWHNSVPGIDLQILANRLICANPFRLAQNGWVASGKCIVMEIDYCNY